MRNSSRFIWGGVNASVNTERKTTSCTSAASLRKGYRYTHKGLQGTGGCAVHLRRYWSAGESIKGVSNIQNVGFQKGEALEKLIREARLSIYPSEWYENCPFSVMESQMYGTPVLGANIGGIPELIQVGKAGELFESGNGEDLERKIEKLWGDNKLCEAYSRNCKNISFDTIDGYYEKIMKVYQ